MSKQNDDEKTITESRFTCIYSKAQFAKASGEHILQNFLGARWTSERIVCDEVQKTFGSTIDKAFEEGIRPIRTLAGTKGGRGGEAPSLKGLDTSDGKTVDLHSGGKPELARPHIKVTKIDENRQEVSVTADPKDVAWAIFELKKQFPQVQASTEEILNGAKPQQGPLGSHVNIEINLGGIDYIRAATKACFNLLAAHGIQVLDPAFDLVREFVLNGKGRMEDFFRWPKETIPGLPNLGPVDHFIGIVNKGSSIEGVLNLFGHIPHSLRFCSNYTGPDIKVGYLVNPLRKPLPAENRSPEFARSVVLDFANQPLRPGPETWAAATRAIDGFARAYFDMSSR